MVIELRNYREIAREGEISELENLVSLTVRSLDSRGRTGDLEAANNLKTELSWLKYGYDLIEKKGLKRNSAKESDGKISAHDWQIIKEKLSRNITASRNGKKVVLISLMKAMEDFNEEIGDLRDKLELEPAVESSKENSWSSVSLSLSNFEHPDENQDALLADSSEGVYVLADGAGMGNEAAEAARQVCNSVMRNLTDKTVKSRLETSQNWEKFLPMALEIVHRDLAKMNMRVGERPDFFSTVAVAKLLKQPDGSTEAVIANVGNSRVYKENANGELTLLTVDQGEVTDYLVDTGKDVAATWKELDELDSLQGASRGLVDLSRGRNKTTTLGAVNREESGKYVKKEIKPGVVRVSLKSGERLLFTTDGVDVLKRSQIADVIKKHKEVDQKVLTLISEVKKALEGNPKENCRVHDDDASVVFVSVL